MREFDARRRHDLDRDRDRTRDGDIEHAPELDVGKRAATDSISLLPEEAARAQLAVADSELGRLANANGNSDAFASSVARMRVERALAEVERLLVIADDEALVGSLARTRRAATIQLAAAFRPRARRLRSEHVRWR